MDNNNLGSFSSYKRCVFYTRKQKNGMKMSRDLTLPHGCFTNYLVEAPKRNELSHIIGKGGGSLHKM